MEWTQLKMAATADSHCNNGYNSVSYPDMELKSGVVVTESNLQHILWAWRLTVSHEITCNVLLNRRKFSPLS